ncbi:hypothetical protein [Chengkuizengella sediminis]|uniref:hypothetical protein n=1 Tax=Chengkuizengella sediminis TaxID=1885917 RepID=UPI001389A5E6|nr:hypothetical protein [Chengkuizengella sediminis]NDI35368.1 hypothetical protein [Chengkuizengella sediminis]
MKKLINKLLVLSSVVLLFIFSLYLTEIYKTLGEIFLCISFGYGVFVFLFKKFLWNWRLGNSILVSTGIYIFIIDQSIVLIVLFIIAAIIYLKILPMHPTHVTFTYHGAKRAEERGFTIDRIRKILMNNKNSRIMKKDILGGEYLEFTDHKGNKVILNHEGIVETVYSIDHHGNYLHKKIIKSRKEG